LTRYKLDLVGLQVVKWERGGILRTGDYNFFYGKGIKTINCEQDYLYNSKYYQQLSEKNSLAIGCHI